jgi:hypothetical protein
MAEPINAAVWRLDIVSFVRTVRLNWIGHANRTDNKRKISQILNNNPQGSRLKGRPKTDGGIVYKQILINAKYKLEREVKNFTELTGRSALWRPRRWTGHVDRPSLELLLMMIMLHFVN